MLVDRLLFKMPIDKHGHFSDHVALNFCLDSSLSFSSLEARRKTWFQETCEEGDPLLVDYAALRYLALIRYVNAQMRLLLQFVLYGYVLLIIGIKTYPCRDNMQSLAC